MMPLSMAKEGEPVVIKKVGGKDETRQFLENLGFVAGGTVTVVSEINGNLIVNVKESRVAIGKDKKSNRKEEKNYENPEKCCRRADSHRQKTDR